MSEQLLQPGRHLVITIGRQFGSGGRELGQALARAFAMEYYDKRLLEEASAGTGIHRAFFERSDERSPLLGAAPAMTALNGGYMPMPWYQGQEGAGALSGEGVYRAQARAIVEVASRGPCVIVGRSADYVLRDHPSARVNIFVHAPLEARVRRVMSRQSGLSAAQARSLVVKTDKLRANYYNFYTDKRWGEATGYDMTVDASLLGVDALVGVVGAYVAGRFGFDPRGGGSGSGGGGF